MNVLKTREDLRAFVGNILRQQRQFRLNGEQRRSEQASIMQEATFMNRMAAEACMQFAKCLWDTQIAEDGGDVDSDALSDVDDLLEAWTGMLCRTTDLGERLLKGYMKRTSAAQYRGPWRKMLVERKRKRKRDGNDDDPPPLDTTTTSASPPCTGPESKPEPEPVSDVSSQTPQE